MEIFFGNSMTHDSLDWVRYTGEVYSLISHSFMTQLEYNEAMSMLSGYKSATNFMTEWDFNH